MASTSLGLMPVMSTVKLKEDGKLVEFYVAKHDYESGLNGAGRTLLVRKDCYSICGWYGATLEDRINAYATRHIDTWLNSTYKNLLDDDVLAAIGTTRFYYTPGNEDMTVTTLERAVFILSGTELGKSNRYYMNVEGSVLPGASILEIAYLNGSAVGQWTRSPNTPNKSYVWRLSSNGEPEIDSDYSQSGARPAFTLPSDVPVKDDGSISLNSVPIISGSSVSGSNLGTKDGGFDFTYSVADADGDAVTVREYLDDVLQRSYMDVLGQTNIFQAVTAGNFQRVLNGEHTLKVIANDGQEDSEAYTVTFTKLVTEASITLAEPIDAGGQISVMVMHLAGSIPSDASLKVEVTNNARDDHPVWEDATASVKSRANHIFVNKTADKGFALNFRVTVERGTSNEGGYISGISGAFE